MYSIASKTPSFRVRWAGPKLTKNQIAVYISSLQMLVVMPSFSFYWPDWNRRLVKPLLSWKSQTLHSIIQINQSHTKTHTHSEKQIFKVILLSFQHDQDIQHDLHVLCQGKRKLVAWGTLNFEQELRRVSTQVMRHPASEPILPEQMRNVCIVFSLLIGIAAHLLLSYLGCWFSFFLTKSR